MIRVLKMIGIVIGSLLLVTVIVVYGTSEWMMRRTHNVPAHPLRVDVAQADTARGERLAKVLGCAGCHDNLTGGIFQEFPDGTRLTAPNLLELVSRYNSAQFARAVRLGVRADGTSVVGMPSEIFAHLADSDIAAIYAYLKRLPRTANTLPSSRIGPGARFMMLTGGLELPADKISNVAPAIRAPLQSNPSTGRYLARATCAECHGKDFRGSNGFAPSLPEMVAAYDRADFERLMRTGIAVGNREVGLMTRMGRRRYSHLQNEEIAALHAYLQSLNR